MEHLVAQRIYGLSLGYEDLNDHDHLRSDPLVAVMVGKSDPKGEDRRDRRDRGKALAGKSTLNRLELTGADASPGERYKKIVMNPKDINDLMVDHFLNAHAQAPEQIILDVDATDDPVHGHQEGRFFHGYYDCYCYLPLYIFCDGFLLSAQLRTGEVDAAKGALTDVKRVVRQIRKKWPRVHILVRGDSGFCRDAIMTWCEQNGIDYVLGLAKNPRLLAEIEDELKEAELKFAQTGTMARIFKNFHYQTLEKTWNRRRRVIAKAEHLDKGSNPRFIVTSLPQRSFPAAPVYETLYCARGDMENRIKEQQSGLFADRTSTATMRGNQLRLYFSSIAYILMHDLRRLALKGTDLERAQCTTIPIEVTENRRAGSGDRPPCLDSNGWRISLRSPCSTKLWCTSTLNLCAAEPKAQTWPIARGPLEDSPVHKYSTDTVKAEFCRLPIAHALQGFQQLFRNRILLI